MTTILGIKTSNPEGIVLTADVQINIEEGDKKWGSEIGSKISCGEWYAIASTGRESGYSNAFFSYLAGNRNFDSLLNYVSGKRTPRSSTNILSVWGRFDELKKELEKELEVRKIKIDNLEKTLLKLASGEFNLKSDVEIFLSLLLQKANPENGTHPIQIAINRKFFRELEIYNRLVSEKKEYDDTIELIMAVNKPRVGLYLVDVHGNVTESSTTGGLEYMCEGSGASVARRYLDDEEYKEDRRFKGLKPDNISISDSFRLSPKAIKKTAHEDSDTGFLVDRVIITENKVDNKYLIVDSLERLEDHSIEEVRERYESS